MSKKYRGKTCVYCVRPGSSTAPDHVLAREFCLKRKRVNLPQVPACEACNREKAALEHYLTAVLPFGGRHADTRENVDALVRQRLENNRKLAAHLAAGLARSFESADGVLWQQSGTMPFDAGRLIRLYEFMAKGLSYHHWSVLLPEKTCVVYGTFLTSAGERLLDRLFATQRVRSRIHGDLSDGVLVYDAVQDLDYIEFTAWRVALYGAQLGGDRKFPAEKPSRGYIITAPRSMQAATQLIERLRGEASSAAA